MTAIGTTGLGQSSLEWLDKKIPALNGGSPKNCLKTEEGLSKLKECLEKRSEWCM
ncbi:MAG: MbcA/ParS/Xre antitoxin family protein [Gracilibacteraceae bacterium]|nr:MbcA/ParS/Xre antitoxin family protein [Gracilibacteraceae bacterium]